MTSIRKQSIERMEQLKAGDPITNICTGPDSPLHHAYFVAYTAQPHRNKFGRVHRDHWARCSNGKGYSWRVSIDVIHPGHLDAETCDKLFAPVWESQFAATSKGGA